MLSGFQLYLSTPVRKTFPQKTFSTESSELQTFIDILASIFLAYWLLGVAYVVRLSWDSIAARFSGLFAILCVVALWPAVLWSEVGHKVRDRARRRGSYRIPSEEYMQAVMRLSAERRERECPAPLRRY